jgi:hypothetical protein
LDTDLYGDDLIVDARAEPERANQMSEEALKEPPLMLEAPPSSMVDLPAGYIDEANTIHREARVRELNGLDEEFLAREVLNVSIPIAQFIDVVLSRNVVQLGSVENPPKELLRKLLRGDRLALALGIRRLTYGDDWELLDVPCSYCQEQFGVIVELGKDLKVRTLSNPRDRTVEVEFRHGHRGVVRFVTGEDELAAVGDGTRTTPELTTTYIDRCLISYDGQPLQKPIGKDLGIVDRKRVIDAIQEHQPGPIMEEVSVPCSHCGQKQNYPLNMADLFRV